MIVWLGVHKDKVLCRVLGSNGEIDVNLRQASSFTPETFLLQHIEGTDHEGVTTPTIGQGATKLCRAVSVNGYLGRLPLGNAQLLVFASLCSSGFGRVDMSPPSYEAEAKA